MHNDSTGGKDLVKHYNIWGFPTIIIADPDSVEIDRIIGFLPPEKFLSELQRIQRGEDTVADLIEKTRKDPNNFELWMTLASKYEDRADLKSAVEVWESVSEVNIGDRLFTEYKLVELYGRINEDVMGLEEYVKNNLDSEYAPYAFRNMINILKRNKNTEAEIGTWKKYLNLMELKKLEAASIYNSYAWRMGELEENLESALEKIRIGINMVSKDDSSTLAGYMDTEAEILWKMGKVDEAVKVIEKCIALQPDDKYFQDQKDKFLED